MYNKITLLGFVTKDSELRYTPGGTAICNVTIATNHSYKKNDERIKETLFMNCVVFGKFAEYLTQHLTKGTLVFAEGRLQEQKWESDGQTRSKMVAILNDVKILNSKEKETMGEPKTEPENTSNLEPF